MLGKDGRLLHHSVPGRMAPSWKWVPTVTMKQQLNHPCQWLSSTGGFPYCSGACPSLCPSPIARVGFIPSPLPHLEHQSYQSTVARDFCLLSKVLSIRKRKKSTGVHTMVGKNFKGGEEGVTHTCAHTHMSQTLQEGEFQTSFLQCLRYLCVFVYSRKTSPSFL